METKSVVYCGMIAFLLGLGLQDPLIMGLGVLLMLSDAIKKG